MSKKEKTTMPKSSDVLLLFTTAADTTWRLFVPTVGGVALGMWADKTAGSRPLWTIVGVICGTMVSLSLVYIQLKKVPTRSQEK
jgi:F0F1-type ATP synthase assembly protein I